MDNNANKLADYSQYGLNQYMMPSNAPITNRSFISALEFESTHEAVQGKVVIASKMGIQNFISQNVGTQAGADFTAGSILNITSVIGFNPPFQNKNIFGNAYLALYQGTTQNAADQIWPTKGANVTGGRYQVQGWYDRNVWNNSPQNIWRGMITDTTGSSTQKVVFAAAWQYIDYTIGVTG